MKRIILFFLIILVFTSCNAKDDFNESSAYSALQSHEPNQQAEQKPSSSEMEANDISIKENATSNISLSERVKELGIDIPQIYIKAVERNTGIPEEMFQYFDVKSEKPHQYSTLEIIEYDRFYIIYLKAGTGYTYGEFNEYHIFENGAYSGAIKFMEPSYDVEQIFYQYKDRVWLVVDTYAGHGMGGPAFNKAKQTWYEISHPDLIAALTFTSQLHGAWIYPEHGTEYKAKVINTEVKQYDGDERFIVTLEWSEKLSTGLTMGNKELDTELFSENGSVNYDYSYEYSYFGITRYHASEKDDDVLYNGDKSMRKITNYIYNQNDTLYGRDKYNFLSEYYERMVQMSQTGTEPQKRWLHDFLDSFDELESINKLYQWNNSHVR